MTGVKLGQLLGQRPGFKTIQLEGRADQFIDLRQFPEAGNAEPMAAGTLFSGWQFVLPISKDV
jgi:hypothetical protein